jgi:hypothetical protein
LKNDTNSGFTLRSKRITTIIESLLQLQQLFPASFTEPPVQALRAIIPARPRRRFFMLVLLLVIFKGDKFIC